MGTRKKAGVCGLMLLTGLALAGCGAYVKYDGKDSTRRGPVGDAGLAVQLAPAGTFDHALLSGVLEQHVTLDGAQSVIDYDALAKSPASSAALTSYRKALFTADPEALKGQNQRLAFWLNAYNASVIAGVLANYEGSAQFMVTASGTFFNAPAYGVAGLTLSLDEIEHGVLRGIWDHPSVVSSPSQPKLRTFHAGVWQGDAVDARIHVALNCAALSCPNLQTQAFSPATLPQDVQAALETFLADPKKGAGENGISALFSWFQLDFDNEAGSVRSFIEKNRKGGLAGVELNKLLTYDWSLNIKR